MNRKEEMSGKKYMLVLGITFCSLLLAVVLLNVIVDPFFNYRMKSEEARQDAVCDQRYSPTWKVGISRHLTDCDAIWVGSSLSTHLETAYLNEVMGVNCKTGIISAGRPNIYKEFIENAFKNNDIKTVYYETCVDHWQWGSGTDYDMSRIPDYIRTETIKDDAPYIFNRTVTVQSLMELKNKTVRHITEPTSAEEGEPAVNLENAIIPKGTSYSVRKMANKIWSNRIYEVDENVMDQYTQAGIENFRTNILPLMEANPETKFVFVVPPTGVTKFLRCRDSGLLDLYIESNKSLFREILSHENVEVHVMLFNLEYNLNLENYMDDCHFEPNGMTWVVDAIESGTYQLTEDNMDELFEGLRAETEKAKWPFLKFPFVNDQVLNLKEKLDALGYTLEVDDAYDEETEQAVKQFQKDNGLEETGIAFEDTMNLAEELYQSLN